MHDVASPLPRLVINIFLRAVSSIETVLLTPKQHFLTRIIIAELRQAEYSLSKRLQSEKMPVKRQKHIDASHHLSEQA